MSLRVHMGMPPQQEGGIGKIFLWLFALIGLVTTTLIAVVVYWEKTAPEFVIPQSSPHYVSPVAGNSVGDKALEAGSKKVALSAEQRVQFERSCNICHGQKGTGAPLSKDIEAWQPRVAQGSKVLLQHTVEGYLGMPPMGMCMECGDAEFKAFIEYMAQVELVDDAASAEDCE